MDKNTGKNIRDKNIGNQLPLLCALAPLREPIISHAKAQSLQRDRGTDPLGIPECTTRNYAMHLKKEGCSVEQPSVSIRLNRKR